MSNEKKPREKRVREKKSRDLSKHQRVNDILLGPLERPALQWFCKHMPGWVTPDILTGLGVVGALIVMIGYALTHVDKGFLWLASFGMFVNWFGDSLDGSLARYRHIERPRYGFFIDHMVDAIAQLMCFLGFAMSIYVRFDVAMLGLIVYYLMDILVLSRMSVQGIFKISYGKIGPTEVRALVILINAVLFFWSPTYQTPLGPFSLFDIILTVLGIGFFVVFLYNVTRLGRILSDIDTQARKQS